MIRGLHGLLYSSDAAATRAFLRDKLELPFSDVGDGWLIFDLPEGDLGVHPTEGDDGAAPGTHDLSFYCDDIEGTVARLEGRGVRFDMDVADHGYGFVTCFTMPGGVRVQLYEPKYRKRPRRKVAPARRKAVAGARRKGTAARRKAPPRARQPGARKAGRRRR